LGCMIENADEKRLEVGFHVRNNKIAFRSGIRQIDETADGTIEKGLSGFKLSSFTTTSLTPLTPPMRGWMKTKASYEEEYVADEAMGTPSKYGVGYTFPALFHVGERGWILVSETGVNSLYCGAKLSEGTSDGLYHIAYPEEGENNGIGSAN